MSFLFLQKDYLALQEKIRELSLRIKGMSHEVKELTTQSSETWHDNFGFEEADRERKRIYFELDKLLKIYEKAKLVEPDNKKNRVAIGSLVTIQDKSNNQEFTYLIGSFLVLKKVQDNEFSYAAPLIEPLLERKAGDVYSVNLEGESRSFTIRGIQ